MRTGAEVGEPMAGILDVNAVRPFGHRRGRRLPRAATVVRRRRLMSDDLDRALRLLGPLERQLMQAVWSGAVPGTFSGRQMLEQVPGLAYTTVTTTLNRLAEKGLLSVEPASGPRPFTYRATGRPADFLTSASEREVSDLLERYGDAALAAFLTRVEELPPAIRVRLEALGRRR